MRKLEKIGFGVGHFYNDAAAAMWFTFLLPYYKSVLSFSGFMSGCVFLVGQLADAVSTVTVGAEADARGVPCLHGRVVQGQRKSWHLLGTLLVSISFPFIFNPVMGDDHAYIHRYQPTSLNYGWPQFIYYAPFVVVFQFAWATVQVNHLSIIPQLVRARNGDITFLNSIRYFFTVTGNLSVLIAGYVLFHVLPSWRHSVPVIRNTSSLLTMTSATLPSLLDTSTYTTVASKKFCSDVVSNYQISDVPIFRYLSLGVVGFGLATSIFFQATVVEEESPARNAAANPSMNNDFSKVPIIAKKIITPKMWLRVPNFYLLSAIYMFSRLIINVPQVYIVLYTLNTLCLHKIHSALIPLTVYTSSMVMSFLIKYINKPIGRKNSFGIGLVFVVAFSIFAFFNNKTSSYVTIYMSAVILGLGIAIVLVDSLSFICEMIGKNDESSAFVYGFNSLLDKFANGFVVWVIEAVSPPLGCHSNMQFYKHVESYILLGFVVVAFFLWLVLLRVDISSSIERKYGDTSNEQYHREKPVDHRGDLQEAQAEETGKTSTGSYPEDSMRNEFDKGLVGTAAGEEGFNGVEDSVDERMRSETTAVCNLSITNSRYGSLVV